MRNYSEKRIYIVTAVFIFVTLYSCKKPTLGRNEVNKYSEDVNLKGLYAVYEKDSLNQASFSNSLLTYAYVGSKVLIIGCAIDDGTFLAQAESLISDTAHYHYGPKGYLLKCDATIVHNGLTTLYKRRRLP